MTAVPFLFFGGFFLLFAFIVVFAIRHGREQQRKKAAVWQRAARRLGIGYGDHQIYGEVRGQVVTVETVTRSHGSAQTTYTVYNVSYPQALGLGLSLTRTGFFTGIVKFFGAQDVEVGDKEFDDAIVVKGTDPGRVVSFLNPGRRYRAQHLLLSLDGCKIRDTDIHYERVGTEMQPEQIVSTVSRMAHMAWHLTGDRTDDNSMEQVIAQQDAGNLAGALTSAREVSIEQDPGAKMLEGDILYTSGDYEGAQKAFETLSDAEPENAEAAAWARQARIRTETPPEPPPPAEVSLDARVVCRELFEQDVSTLSIVRVFEEKFLGQGVAGAGVLKAVDTYTYDLAFPDTEGTRATIEIGEVEGSAWGDKMFVIVQLDTESAATEWKSKIGERIHFEGKMVRCDAFMRNIYVANTSLTTASRESLPRES